MAKPDRYMKKQARKLKKWIHDRYRKPLIDKYGKKAVEEGIEVTKFKKVVLDMYRGFPNYIYYGNLDELVTSPGMMDHLVANGFFIGVRGRENAWRLGATALPLVSAWKSEEYARKSLQLSKVMKRMTWVLAMIGTVTLIISVLNLSLL